MGKRWGAFLVGTLLLLPVAAQAQAGKPSGNVWTRSAEVYIESGQKASNPVDKMKFFKQALDQALLATQKDPNNSLGWELAGRTYFLMGQTAQADTTLRKAETLWPAYSKENDLLRQQAWVDAYNAGVSLVKANKFDEAVPKLQAADAIYQGRAGARLILASIYLNNRDYDNAVKYYEGALDILNGPASKGLPPAQAKMWDEDRQRATERLGQLLMATRKYDEAVKFFQQQVAANPNQPDLKLTLARAMALSGKEADAKAMFAELLSAPNLTDNQYTEIGIALFRGHDFPNASSAFRKAVALNPYNHAALYNLSQSLLAQAQPIEEQRQNAATPAARKPFAAQLQPIFTELKDVTDRFLVVEPANATAMKLASATARGTGDIATDPKVESAAKAQALALLQRADSLTFDISDTSLLPTEDGVKVTGTVMNRKLAAGAPIHLKVTFLSKDGTALETQDVNLAAPAKGQTSDLSVASKAKDVTGWKYEVVK